MSGALSACKILVSDHPKRLDLIALRCCTRSRESLNIYHPVIGLPPPPPPPFSSSALPRPALPTHTLFHHVQLLTCKAGVNARLLISTLRGRLEFIDVGRPSQPVSACEGDGFRLELSGVALRDLGPNTGQRLRMHFKLDFLRRRLKSRALWWIERRCYGWSLALEPDKVEGFLLGSEALEPSSAEALVGAGRE